MTDRSRVYLKKYQIILREWKCAVNWGHFPPHSLPPASNCVTFYQPLAAAVTSPQPVDNLAPNHIFHSGGIVAPLDGIIDSIW